MRLILALMLAAPPALAQTALDPATPAKPGAVALYLQAHALVALGQQAQDPLTVLAAARLLRGLTLTETPRTPDPVTEPTPLTPLDPATVLDMARNLDAGGNYPDLIETVATEITPQPLSLRATAATLPPGAAQTWTLPFYGGTYAELAILGAGTGNLDLAVADSTGAPICLDNGSGDTAFCGFALRDNGTVTVTVTNPGTTPASYTLLTD